MTNEEQDPSSKPKIYEKRNEMGMELLAKMKSHPKMGNWQEYLPGVGFMLNSASYYEGQEALRMVVEDTVSAHRKNTPPDIVRFALEQVVEWRNICLKEQGRADGDIYVGEITMEILEKELHGKIPDNYLEEVFLK